MPTLITSLVTHLLQLARITRLGIALLIIVSGLLAAGQQTSATATQAANRVYLPFMASSGQAAPDPAPGPQESSFFVEPDKKTSRPGLAIDARGGMHMAYRYHVPYAEHPQVVYAYCPPPSAQCTDPAKWGRVAFLDRAEEVQIELTPAGAPRLLAMLGDAENSFGAMFVYLECDANCLSEDSWSAIGVQTRNDTLGRAFEGRRLIS